MPFHKTASRKMLCLFSAKDPLIRQLPENHHMTQLNLQRNQNFPLQFSVVKIAKVCRELSQTILAKKTQEIRDENKELEEKSAQLTDEISQLKQSCSTEVMKMMEAYFAAQEQVKILRDQIIEAQTHLKALNDQTIEIQE